MLGPEEEEEAREQVAPSVSIKGSLAAGRRRAREEEKEGQMSRGRKMGPRRAAESRVAVKECALGPGSRGGGGGALQADRGQAARRAAGPPAGLMMREQLAKPPLALRWKKDKEEGTRLARATRRRRRHTPGNHLQAWGNSRAHKIGPLVAAEVTPPPPPELSPQARPAGQGIGRKSEAKREAKTAKMAKMAKKTTTTLFVD